MPVIPDILLRTVAFIYRDSEAGQVPAGTGFFVHRPVPVKSDAWFVTARHVVDDSASVWVRVNRPLNAGPPLSFEIRRDEWQTPTDERVDIAAVPLDPGPDSEVLAVSPQMFLTPAMLGPDGIGQGDEVFLIGLLPQHVEARNIPVVRHGHLAMVPFEAVAGARGPTRMLLIEMAAYPGQSGSPVFVYLAPGRVPGVVAIRNESLILAGVMHGAFQQLSPVLELSEHKLVYPESVGIALVTPFDLFHELMLEVRNREMSGEITAVDRARPA